MTFTITKAKLGIAILAMALLVPATAWATHSFDDVADGAFYHDASAWAKTNGITVGSGNCGGTGNNFCGELGVTRGENITFAHRYDTNIVQPALTTLTGTAAANSAAIVANDVDIAANTALSLGIATIPSGTTVTGYDTWDHAVIADDADIWVAVRLPGRAPTALTSNEVNFETNALAADGDPQCTGSAAVPTAPAGKVCLYISVVGGVDTLTGEGVSETSFQTTGFQVRFLADSNVVGTDAHLRFTWAYTAP